MAFQAREIFNGAIPPVCLSQIMRVVDFANWNSVWVGCSGTFSFERAIRQKYTALPIHGNDVSLLSGMLAAIGNGEEIPFRFVGKVERYEEWLQGRDYHDRCAALLMVLGLARVYGSDNVYNRKHWRAAELELDKNLAHYRTRLEALGSELKLTSYFAGDFRVHLANCIAADGGYVIYAPFIEGWYERWFRFINENIEWTAPTYDIWSPSAFPALVDEIHESGIPYVAAYSHEIPSRKLVAYHRMGMKPKVYVYADNTPAKASVIDQSSNNGGIPFAFKAVDISKLGPKTQVSIYPCKAGHADYIKSLYLQETIAFTSGMVNFLIYFDDMLAGILTFNKSQHNVAGFAASDIVYLLSDTSTTRFGRVSKCIAMLATCSQVLESAGARLLHRPVQQVITTVRSNMPVSMKYRGIYNLLKKTEAGAEERSGSKFIINYGSPPRALSPQEVYNGWWQKHFKDDRERRVTSSYAKPASGDQNLPD